MKVLIAGGSGFLGKALTQSLLAEDHQVNILSRSSRSMRQGVQTHLWDGRTTKGWGQIVNDMDVIVNLTGQSLSSWPWTPAKKQKFLQSRVQPGLALAQAVQDAQHRPAVFIQISGINHYGLKGGLADESTLPGNDFLAQLTVQWEAATKTIEELGVRRVVVRTPVVLARRAGLLPMMSLPIRLFVGGPIGSGQHAVPWIHIQDWVGGIRYLIQNESARGAYNLVAPVSTSNAEFNRLLAEVLHRPYWFPTPAFLLKVLLGEMSVLIVEGRFSQPKRLIKSGYHFQYVGLREALSDLYR